MEILRTILSARLIIRKVTSRHNKGLSNIPVKLVEGRKRSTVISRVGCGRPSLNHEDRIETIRLNTFGTIGDVSFLPLQCVCVRICVCACVRVCVLCVFKYPIQNNLLQELSIIVDYRRETDSFKGFFIFVL